MEERVAAATPAAGGGVGGDCVGGGGSGSGGGRGGEIKERHSWSELSVIFLTAPWTLGTATRINRKIDEWSLNKDRDKNKKIK